MLGERATSAQVTSSSVADLVGRLVVGALNLGLKRIAGFKSECLVLASIEPDGTVLLLDPDPRAKPGAPVA